MSERRLRRAVLASLMLGVTAALMLTTPGFARVAIAAQVQVAGGCNVVFTAQWSGLPGRVRTFDVVHLSDGAPTLVLEEGPAVRDGSYAENWRFEGSGTVGSRITFYDAKGRVVAQADNAEGPLPFSC